MSDTPTVISVINLKGGVGKTTVTALLARYAARQWGLDVLAVDLDPQANLSQALMTEPDYRKFMEEKQPSIVELFGDFAPTTQNKPGPSPLNPADVVKTVSAWGGKEILTKIGLSKQEAEQ
ncbi:ParA family protein [Candidatus Spongiihabitans sp.]|uniref:ParA family protein n=1 Tax=Candidatus Spongiihabitans sp. TaxID=3101308 RepID=UPI003C7B6AFF